MYVLTNGGRNIVKFPYSIAMLKKAINPSTLKIGITDDQLEEEHNVHKVIRLTDPDYDVETEYLEQDELPTYNNGVWELGRSVRKLPQSRIDKRAETLFKDGRIKAKPQEYDEFDIEVLEILFNEVQHGNDAKLCAIIAKAMDMDVQEVRQTIVKRADEYHVNLVGLWAKRRLHKGGI